MNLFKCSSIWGDIPFKKQLYYTLYHKSWFIYMLALLISLSWFTIQWIKNWCQGFISFTGLELITSSIQVWNYIHAVNTLKCIATCSCVSWQVGLKWRLKFNLWNFFNKMVQSFETLVLHKLIIKKATTSEKYKINGL